MNAFEAVTKAAAQSTSALDGVISAIRRVLGDTYDLRRGIPTRRQLNLAQAQLSKRQGAENRAVRRYRAAHRRYQRPQLLHKGGKP